MVIMIMIGFANDGRDVYLRISRVFQSDVTRAVTSSHKCNIAVITLMSLRQTVLDARMHRQAGLAREMLATRVATQHHLRQSMCAFEVPQHTLPMCICLQTPSMSTRHTRQHLGLNEAGRVRTQAAGSQGQALIPEGQQQ